MAIEATLASFRDAVVRDQSHQLSMRLRSGGMLDVSQRIVIYQNNRQQTLLAVMGKQYPVTKQVVGAGCFDQLCVRYDRCHPATSCDLDAYGEHFATFLEGIETVGDKTPYLADLCRLEYALVQSYYAKERSALDVQVLNALPAEQQSQVVFQLAADVIPLCLNHDVHQLWQQHQTGMFKQTFTCPMVRTDLVVARDRYKPKANAVDQPETSLLKALQEKKTVGQLMSSLDFSEAALISLLHKGWIDGFHVAA